MKIQWTQPKLIELGVAMTENAWDKPGRDLSLEGQLMADNPPATPAQADDATGWVS